MRRSRRRTVLVGILLVALAVGFFLGMLAMAPRSNDPVAMMRAVGQVAGAVGGLGVAMIAFGLLRKPAGG